MLCGGVPVWLVSVVCRKVVPGDAGDVEYMMDVMCRWWCSGLNCMDMSMGMGDAPAPRTDSTGGW